jgi:pimeloyl-ACP methyl ester carboxylesterase
VQITTQVVPGPGGRQIRVGAADFPGGFPVLVQAGSPGSRRMYGPAVDLAARDYGLRLISYDRPGFGDSPPQPGRTIGSAAADTRAIAQALGLPRLAVWGFSGGGQYALACAALLPDLVTACVSMSTLAPYGQPDLDWAAPWGAESQADVALFFADREAARRKFRDDAAGMATALCTPEGWMARWGAAAGTDAAHGRDVAEYLAAVGTDCLQHGDQGWWDDWVAILSPWGFDVADIRCPVQVWAGQHDQAAPVSHNRWLAARIPGADAHFTDDDHSTIDDAHRAETYAFIARHR